MYSKYANARFSDLSTNVGNYGPIAGTLVYTANGLYGLNSLLPTTPGVARKPNTAFWNPLQPGVPTMASESLPSANVTTRMNPYGGNTGTVFYTPTVGHVDPPPPVVPPTNNNPDVVIELPIQTKYDPPVTGATNAITTALMAYGLGRNSAAYGYGSFDPSRDMFRRDITDTVVNLASRAMGSKQKLTNRDQELLNKYEEDSFFYGDGDKTAGIKLSRDPTRLRQLLQRRNN